MGKGAAMFLGSGDFIFLLGVGLVVSGEGKKKKFTMVFFWVRSFFIEYSPPVISLTCLSIVGPILSDVL